MRHSGIRLGTAFLLASTACAPKIELATEKPIELNLNIRVQQEVRIKLDREVEELIRAERNPSEVRSRGLDVPLPDAEDSTAVKHAKRVGLVGERFDGYLGIVELGDGERIAANETLRLVDRVNAERLAFYRRMADRHDASLEDVEAIAGVHRVERAQPGEFVLTPDQTWRAQSG